MKTNIIDENGVVSLGNISNEKDSKENAKININSSPEDRWCDCCGRHISQLTPFGKAGDPLVGDFDGLLLVKGWRRMGPYDEQAEKAWMRVEKLMEKEGQVNELSIEMINKSLWRRTWW